MMIRRFVFAAIVIGLMLLCPGNCDAQLAFIRDGKIVVADLDGQNEQELPCWTSVQKVLWLNEQELLILQDGDLYIACLDQPDMPITLTRRGDIYQVAHCPGSGCLYYAAANKKSHRYKSQLVEMGFEITQLYERQLCQGMTWVGAQMAASKRWLYVTNQPRQDEAGMFRVALGQESLPRAPVFNLASDQLPQIPVMGLAVEPNDQRLVFALAIKPKIRYQLIPIGIPGQRWSMAVRLPEEVQGCCLMPNDQICFSIQDELGLYNLWLVESSTDPPGLIVLKRQLTQKGGHSPSAIWPEPFVR